MRIVQRAGRRAVIAVAAGALYALCASAHAAASSRPGWGATLYREASGTGVTFRVWAPNAAKVQLIGEFNSFVPGNDLAPEGTTGVWSVDVPGARAGQEYKYLINDTLYRRDPRGRQVSVSGLNSVVVDTNAYAWAVTNYTPPAKNGLVIYELHVGTFYDPNTLDFTPAKLTEAIGGLDHLRDLGVNCVQVMPVWEFSLSHSWGYNPSDIFAIENQVYGGAAAFKQFVDACHARGLAVMMDVVHNHWGPDDLDVWEFDGWGGGTNDGGIYFYNGTGTNGLCCTTWGPRPNYSRPQVRQYIRDNFRQWLDEYKVDGFRWDSPMNIISWRATNPIPEGASLVREINGMMASNYPGRLSLGEDANLDVKFDSEWHVAFHDNILAQLVQTNDVDRNMFVIADQLAYTNGFFRTVFTENHDKAGVLNQGLRAPAAIDTNNPASAKAWKLSSLGAVLTLTAPGIPLLFMGQEFFEPSAFTDTAPLDWGRARLHMRTTSMYRDLIRMRRNLDGGTAGLLAPNIDVFHVNDGAKVLAYRRWNLGQAGDDVVVVVNFSGATWPDYNLPFPVAGTWHTHFNSDWALYATNNANYGYAFVQTTGATPRASVRLAPYSALIMSRTAAPLRDADGDAMPDSWELVNGLNPNHAGDATLNPDGDLFDNVREYERGTRPQIFELHSGYTSMAVAATFNGWNPAAANMKLRTNFVWHYVRTFAGESGVNFKFAAQGSWARSWGDQNQEDFTPWLGGVAESNAVPHMAVAGMLQGLYRLELNETNDTYSFGHIEFVDADADGMADEWERFYALNPTQAADAGLNPDGDAYTNYEEYRFGLNPAAVDAKSSAYRAMSVAGTFNAWNPAASNMVLVADHLWEWDTDFTNLNGLVCKFAANGSWTTNWGDYNQYPLSLPLEGVAEPDGPDIIVTGLLHGAYRFRFDDLSRAYDIRPVYTTALQGLTVAADFNDWQPSLYNMSLTSNYVWSADLTFTGQVAAQFKFAANGGWTVNWGDGAQSNLVAPLAGRGSNYAANIQLAGPLRGNYRFIFHETSHLYRVEFAPLSVYTGLFVAGTFNSWNPGTAPMTLVDNNTWQYETNLYLVTNLAFKFAAHGSWAVNWGDTNQTGGSGPVTGTADSYGSDIDAPGLLVGVYRFLFHDETKAYSFQRIPRPDGDGDGLPDSWEMAFGLNPSNALDGAGDSDGDGVTNLREFQSDTRPNDAASMVDVERIQAGGTSVTLRWTGGAAVTQYVEQAYGPAGPWSAIHTGRPPTPLTNQITQPLSGSSQAVYRIRTSLLQP